MILYNKKAARLSRFFIIENPTLTRNQNPAEDNIPIASGNSPGNRKRFSIFARRCLSVKQK